MQHISDTKILITGASGFIGSRLVACLNAAGYDVYGVSRGGMDCRGKPCNDDFKLIQGDFADTPRMTEILSDIKPHIIIHCAGVMTHSGVGEGDYSDVNVSASSALLETILDYNQNLMNCRTSASGAGCNDGIRIINCSTIAVYGAPQSADGVVSEVDACAPQSAYAQSKYDFEQILAGSDVPYLTVRIANISGKNALFNHILNTGEADFYGEVPYVRDFIHPDDLCRLFANGIEHLMDGGESLTVNAGSGVGLKFTDVIDEIERQTGRNIVRHHRQAKQGDVVKILCNITRAKRVLGWVPDHTTLTEIIDYALHHQQL